MTKLYSGNAAIDSVLMDAGLSWPAVNSWSRETTVGSGVNLTFDWMTSAGDRPPAGGFEQFTVAQREGAVAALNLVSDVANVTFTYDNQGTADIEFGTLAFGGSSRSYTSGLASTGWTITPTTTYFTHSDVYLTNSFSSNDDLSVGTDGFATVLHEIGHALGLEHTFENRTPPPGTDTTQYSIESYTDHSGTSAVPQSFMLYDIAALQYLYGANMTTRTGDTTYTWDTGASVLETIWDAGGTDTIDASNQLISSTISLEAGTFSSIGSNGRGGIARDNIGIAFGATIENAKGGAAIDRLVGNEVANVLEGGGAGDTLLGMAGDDRLVGGAGADYLDGGAGINIADLRTSNAAVTVDLAAGTGGGGHAQGDTYVNITAVWGSSYGDTFSGNGHFYGYDGSDTFTSSNGVDVFIGGADADRYVFGADFGTDYIYTFADGADVLDFTGFSAFASFDDLTSNHASQSGDDVRLSDGANTIVLVSTQLSSLNENQFSFAEQTNGSDQSGNQGSNPDPDNGSETTADQITFRGTQDSETLTGNVENNELFGMGGNDVLYGQAGNDLLEGASGYDVLIGGEGDDTVRGFANNDYIDGGTGNNVLEGGAGYDTVSYASQTTGVVAQLHIGSVLNYTSGDTDTVSGFEALIGTASHDYLVGTSDGNLIIGSDGHDTVYGLGGNDIILGGAGFDTLNGGEGYDTFVFDAAELTSGIYATVKDFANAGASYDTVQLRGLSASDVSVADYGGGAIVTTNELAFTGGILFEGISAADLQDQLFFV